jgi:phenylalanyl-tRNA synthetase beta subunit
VIFGRYRSRAVLGLGGVMGGESSGVTDSTTNVFIESAYFDPKRTARTGRRLNIQSDARFRFERGVDPAFVVPGLELATGLVLELCGGEPGKIEIAGKAPKPNAAFKFDPGLVARLSGLDLGTSEIKHQLEALGVELDGKGKQIKAAPPSWRPDISAPVDLVEEVVRLTGVANVPATPMRRAAGVARPVLTEMQKRQRLTRRVLAARGLVEAVTWSFVAPEHARLFGGGAPELVLSNPISSQLAVMRPSLLPGLVTAAQRNRDRGFADGALFELGQAYRGANPEDQFVAACLGTGVGDIFRDRRREQHRLLEHDAELISQVGQFVIAQIHTVDENGAPSRVVQARQQADQRGLAAARAPENADVRPGLHLQRNAAQHRMLRRVAKPYIPKFDLAFRSRERPSVRFFIHLRDFVQRFLNSGIVDFYAVLTLYPI